MKIQFERTGGIAGMVMTAVIDSEALSREEAREVRELVVDAGFFDLPAEIAGETEGKDLFLFRLTIDYEGRRHSVTTSQEAAPPSLLPLLQWLTKAARRAQRGKRTP